MGAMKEEDMKKREAVEVKNTLDGNIFNVEKSLNEHKSKIDQGTIDDIENAIREAKESINSEDLDRMNQAKTNLDQASMKIGQAMYAQGNQSSENQGEQQSEQQSEQQNEQNQEGEQKSENNEKKN